MNYLILFRNRIIALTILSLIVTTTIITILTLGHVNRVRDTDTQDIIRLSCQENANKVNSYFRTSEQSIKLVSDYIKRSVETYGRGNNVDSVMDRVQLMCTSAANNIKPAVSAFMRLNPELYPDVPGFYCIKDADSFRTVKPTNLLKYEKNDEKVDWYYGTVDGKSPRWTKPYTDSNTGWQLIMYVIPIFNDDEEIGVVGMELSLNELDLMINESPVYESGYAFLSDSDGNPVDFGRGANDSAQKWLSSEQSLRNGMSITVLAPYNVIKREQDKLINDICLITLISLIISITLSLLCVIKVFSTLEEKVFEVQASKSNAIDAANRANQAKMEFFSRMSHDIRTPLNGIIGMLEILRRNRDNDAKVDDCIEKIDLSANHLLSLVNDILDLQRLENGKMSFAKESFDLDDILNNCMVIVSSQAEKDNISVSLDKINIKHTRLMGSALRIRQVLLNILSNAIKYNKANGSIIFTAEEIESDGQCATFKFVIQDSGIGMKPEYVKHVFDRFSQENGDARTKYKGTGLGMYITKAIIDEIGGDISIASEYGEGSIFTVILPIEIDNADPVSAITDKEAEQANYDCSGINVLLVEDNQLNSEIAQQLLEDSGVIVRAVENGQDAVNAFAKNPKNTFDVILMDIMMPVMDGYTATRTIRSFARDDAKTIPIIAMTANALEEDVKRCMDAGMNEHVAKPLDMNRVLALLSKYKKN